MMKKIVALCLFVFAMVLGTESVTAQTQTEISKEAVKTTKALRKIINLDKKQCDEVYEILKVYGEKITSLNRKSPKSEVTLELEKEMDLKIKGVLSEQQYLDYKTYLKKKN